jgi:hypothetical protein
MQRRSLVIMISLLISSLAGVASSQTAWGGSSGGDYELDDFSSSQSSNGLAHPEEDFWDISQLQVLAEAGATLTLGPDGDMTHVQVAQDSDVPDHGYLAYSVPSVNGQFTRIVETTVSPWSDELSITSHTLACGDGGSRAAFDGGGADSEQFCFVVANGAVAANGWDWWECAWAGVCGVGQGGVNIVNGVQDTVIGVANLPARAVNGIAWVEEKVGILDPDDAVRVPYIPSPDWSKDLIVPEDDLSHSISKGAGAAGVEILSGVWIARIAKVPQVAKVVSKLPGKIGKTGPIKRVPNRKALDDLYDQVSKGGKTVNPGTYPGVVKELPNGTIVRRRPNSGSGGPTIDITLPDGTNIKVHIE